MDDRYYSSYRRFTFDFGYEDQEEYTRYEDELADLELKEVVPDEEYNNNVSRLEALNDMEELERYRKNNVSESEYHFTREELIAGMNEIEIRYRVTEEKKREDRAMRAKFSRDRLKMIKRTYESRGINNNISRLNVDALSDEDVITMYTYVTRDKTPEEVRELELGAVRDRTKNYVRPGSLQSDSETSVEDTEVTLSAIESELERFRNTSNKVDRQMNELNRKLVIGELADLDVTETINGLDTEISDLREMGRVILEDMDQFRLSTESADFSMSPSEVKRTIDGFTKRFKDLKIMHQEKYNARVDYTNKKIDELKAMTDLDDEVRVMIDALTKLDRSDNVIKSYTQKNYLDNIDYNKLVEVNNQIAEIQSRLGVKSIEDGLEGMEADISDIEKRLDDVETELATELSADRIAELNQDLNLVANSINDFRQNLEFNKDKLTEEEYNNYKNRIETAENKLNELRIKLGKNVTYSNVYKELDEKTKNLSANIDRLHGDVEAFFGYLMVGGKLVFEDRTNDLRNQLDKLNDEIEANKNDIEQSQYESLLNKVNAMKEKLEKTEDRIKDPGMIKDADIFALLNGEITGLENALSDLETQIERLEKPIKREDRKNIDAIIKHLEKEVNRLLKLAEQYKEKDPDKYNATVERLNDLKGRLDKTGKEYRNKCPLMVKAVKSAKNFFKKHKKACLIIAGLAAFALVSYHVLIPAIMHGNIMIAGTSSALRPFIKFTNKILGGMIGAVKNSSGIWSLASGVVINPSCAATSLLKGLAISGISSTALVAPVVIAIKKLVEKMKTTELKQKISEGLEKGKETAKNTVDKAKNAALGKLNKTKNSNKKVVLKTEADAKKLLEEYRKNSNKMSFEDFVADKELSEDELNFLKAYIVIMKKNITEQEEYKNAHTSSGKRGK